MRVIAGIELTRAGRGLADGRVLQRGAGLLGHLAAAGAGKHRAPLPGPPQATRREHLGGRPAGHQHPSRPHRVKEPVRQSHGFRRGKPAGLFASVIAALRISSTPTLSVCKALVPCSILLCNTRMPTRSVFKAPFRFCCAIPAHLHARSVRRYWSFCIFCASHHDHILGLYGCWSAVSWKHSWTLGLVAVWK